MEHQFSTPSHRQLAAICYHNLALRLPTLPAFSFDLVHNIHSRQHLAKHHMLPVQPTCCHCGDEKLGSVCISPGIGHGQKAWTSVLDLEVLIRKLQAVDRFTTPPVPESEVTSLEHEAGDDSVELTSLVVEGFATLANPFLSCAKSSEVLCRLRNSLPKKPHDNPACGLAVDLDVEVDLVGNLRQVLLSEVDEHLGERQCGGGEREPQANRGRAPGDPRRRAPPPPARRHLRSTRAPPTPMRSREFC
uniref:Uncharacterized protein n=1 Tax=Zea mays TaxID=4577 RepID=C0P3X8_MAIZE|nr:unknown [Zea mays]